MSVKANRKPMGLIANEAQRERVQRKLEVLGDFLRTHPAPTLSAGSTYRGVPIGRFATSCRYRHRNGDPSPWLSSALEAIPGWTWETARSPDDAMPNVKGLREYVGARGWAGISRSTSINGSPIGAWIINVRSAYRKVRLSENLQAALEGVPGWTWEPHPALRDQYPTPGRAGRAIRPRSFARERSS